MKEEVSRKVQPREESQGYVRGDSGRIEEGEGGKVKINQGIRLPLVGDIMWSEVWAYGKEWISNPLNMALTFWCILCIVPSIIILVMESGALDSAIPDEFVREEWVEVSNQVLNALFVLMCLVWHPVFCRLSFMLYRWTLEDVQQLRSEYCRGKLRKPHEWWHISVIVFWFHMTCFATYSLAAVYWIYNRWDRPTLAVLVTVSVSFGSPIIAFTYNIFSPLGRDFYLETEGDMEPGGPDLKESKSGFYLSQKVVPYPQWRGGVLTACCQKPRLAIITAALPFCVFGLNMERLGFGQRWVQAASFILIVIGPCLVFEVSAHTVVFYSFQQTLILGGILLALLGLLYGAYWRSQMRKKFRLPASRWCLGSAALTDAAIWLFCCWCAICQEVRTAEYYDIGDNIFYEKSEEERRRLAEGEGLKAVGLGEASKKVARLGEGLKGGLEDAGSGVARIFSKVGELARNRSGSLTSVTPVDEEDIESGGGSGGSSTTGAMDAPSPPVMGKKSPSL